MRVASPVVSLRFPLFSLLLMRHQLGPEDSVPPSPAVASDRSGLREAVRPECLGGGGAVGPAPAVSAPGDVLPGWGEGGGLETGGAASGAQPSRVAL